MFEEGKAFVHANLISIRFKHTNPNIREKRGLT